MMRDHPGWDNLHGAWLRGTMTSQGAPVVIDAADVGNGAELFDVPVFPGTLPPSLAAALCRLGPVRRWRNPSLWDAVATAIIRQVIRADQARIQHRRLRRTFGPCLDTPHGPVHTLPTPETVAGLSRDDLAGIGMAFKAAPLRHAALAYIEHGVKWTELPGERLVEELQTVPRIGPWTAGATAADHLHDWSLYPYSDLAVRTWARTAAPDVDWPADEQRFAERWRAITSDQLGPITLFTLAWGAQHAGAASP